MDEKALARLVAVEVERALREAERRGPPTECFS